MNREPKVVLGNDDDVAERVEAIDRVEQLVAQGRSRLTAHRIVQIEREEAEVGRARRSPPPRL